MGVRIYLRPKGVYARHTATVFKAARDLLYKLVCDAGEDTGEYELVPKRKVRWRVGENNSIAFRSSQDLSLTIRIKISGNDECWDYALVPLGGGNMDTLATLQNTVQAWLGAPPDNLEDPEEEIPEMPGDSQQGPENPATPPTPPNPLTVLDKLRDAIKRRDERTRLIQQTHCDIATVDEEIAKLNKVRDDHLTYVLELEQANASDADIKMAEQFVELLSRLS